ncbi:MAG: four-carbon acid sugar kinase family protein [Lachnospiraceae bacterium]|nr:four-carbon acid sugar kinase family protein [Lachnospiraceae bacterium]
MWMGIVADDFTGASDTASFLVEAGVPTILFNGIPKHIPELDEDCAALVVALKTRTLPAADGVRESMDAFRWLKAMGAKKLYLKYCSTFDSTEEGNIGPVVDAVLEEYQIPCTVLCPSLPVNGRTVKDGKLYVNGVLLEESHMKDHPLTPMRKSDVGELMEAQARYKAIKLEEDKTEEEWSQQVLDREEKGGHFYVIPDYFEESHGDRIARAFWDLPFFTGGSGLAGALGRICAERIAREEKEKGDLKQEEQVSRTHATAQKELESKEREDGRRSLMLAGSCSAITLEQIRDYEEKGYRTYRIEPEKLLDHTLTAEQLQDWILKTESKGLVYSSAAPENIKKAQKLGKERIAALIERTLSGLARQAVARGYGILIVAGGETSGAVTQALGYQAFKIGPSVAPGVPVMTPLENQEVRLVLKSGNFGQRDFFERALRVAEETF